MARPTARRTWGGVGAEVLALLLCALALPARAQNPVPLPTDNRLAAYVGVSGNFRSVALQQNRNLSMSAWVAAFAPNEAFDYSALIGRAFLSIGLPPDDGWGLFDPLDENLTILLLVTDTQNRLGHALVYDHATGALLTTLAADAPGGRIQGSFLIAASVRDYRIEVRAPNSTLLATLAADVGKWDRVVPFIIPKGFEPYRPATISCPHNAGGDRIQGTLGNPLNAAGTTTGIEPIMSSIGCALRDYANDAQNSLDVGAPGDYATYEKKRPILDTASLAFGQLKIGDPADRAAVQAAITAALARDNTLAITPVTVPPYSTGAGHWHAVFQGQATAVMVVPYERRRRTDGLGILIGAIATAIAPEKSFLSLLALQAGQLWLADQRNRQTSGFTQKDLSAVGDIYSLMVQLDTKNPDHVAPIFQDVTFVLQPDIAPPTGSGYGSLDIVMATTAQPPPSPIFEAQITFTSPSWTATRRLPKGYKYKVTGNITDPKGYEVSPQQPILFWVPGSTNVTIPCTLNRLIELKVKTTAPNGANEGALVKVKLNGAVVYQKDSARNPDGTYTISFFTLTPGVYQVTATGGAPPAEGAAVTVNVVPAVILNVSVSYGAGIGPPPPP